MCSFNHSKKDRINWTEPELLSVHFEADTKNDGEDIFKMKEKRKAVVGSSSGER